MAQARPQRVLSQRAARTLYNVADALLPPAVDGGPGAGDLDLLPHVERRLRWEGVRAVRLCWALLAAIEWQAPLTGRSRVGFSRLPRKRRRELLRRWEYSRLAPRRAAFGRLRDWLEQAFDDARAAGPAAEARPQSSER